MTDSTSEMNLSDLLQAVAVQYEAQGGVFKPDIRKVAIGLIEEKVDAVAEQLGVQPTSVLRSYGDLFDPAKIAETLIKAREAFEKSMTSRPSKTLNLHEVGRVLASVGRAAWLVNVNHEAFLNEVSRSDALDVLSAASDAITRIGMDLAQTQPPATEITLSSEAVTSSVRALTYTLRKLRLGAWSAGDRDLDEGMKTAMANDLALIDS